MIAGMISVITAILLITGRQFLAQLYTNDLGVIDIAVKVMLFAAAFQLVDAVQCVASYALRGYKVTKLPMIIHMIAFWGLVCCRGIIWHFIKIWQSMAFGGACHKS